MKFRVLTGCHSDTDPSTGQDRMYRAGMPGHDVVETNVDLCELLNTGAGAKFARVSDDTPVTPLPRTVTPGATPPIPPRLPVPVPTEAAKAVVPADPHHAVNQPPIRASDMKTFEAMSLKQLTDWAAEEEFDLKGARTKDDALKVIRGQAK